MARQLGILCPRRNDRGFVGFAILVAVLIWAEGSKHVLTIIARLTWSKVTMLTLQLPMLAWPGAVAGLAGGSTFGFFACWAEGSR